MALIIDPDLLTDSATDNNLTEVFINTTSRTIKLTTVGNLTTDGVTLKALYSFLKEEWRNDPFAKNLAAFPFPMVPITDESFEFVEGWDFLNDGARNLIRTAGWTVRNTSGAVTAQFAGIIGLGAIEANDQLYYNQGVGATNVVLTGQINQAVQILSDPNGDGVFSDGFDRRTTFSLFAREYQQIYGKSSLADIGVTTMGSIAYRFPISTTTDLKILDTDVNVATNAPYTQIRIRYFDQPFTKNVDTGVGRNFGIVIDVGTHSGVDGSTTAAGNTLTSTEGGIIGADYTGGTIRIHEGANMGLYNIVGTPTATAVVTSGTFSAGTNQSFTLYRATPVSATAEQIYTRIQHQLRQGSDIDATNQTVIGRVADELLNFVGDTLICGSRIPVNPNGGGSGVLIEGFLSADTNRIEFFDNTATRRTYPFVAVLTINFGDNLRLDPSARYWVYFTTLPGTNNDFGETGALIVDNNANVDMAGAVSGVHSLQQTFNYDGNVQGGRIAGTDAGITVVGIGLSTGQYVRATGTIARSTANSVSLVAALERNYANP